VTLPAFVTRLARGDTVGLKKMIAPAETVVATATPGKAAPGVAGGPQGVGAAAVSKLPEASPEELPPRAAGGGGGR
jgi:hypothetical protein